MQLAAPVLTQSLPSFSNFLLVSQRRMSKEGSLFSTRVPVSSEERRRVVCRDAFFRLLPSSMFVSVIRQIISLSVTFLFFRQFFFLVLFEDLLSFKNPPLKFLVVM